MNTTLDINTIATLTLAFLERHNVVSKGAGKALTCWPADGRVIIQIDPFHLRAPEALHSGKMLHRLSSTLEGRRVVHTNSRGYFLQIGLTPPPARRELTGRDLDVNAQPIPTAVPIGDTHRGPLWIDLLDADSVLVGGSRGGGKTNVLHGWIQALIRGGAVELLLWDGKGGVEFWRYAGAPNVRVVTDDLHGALRAVQSEIQSRRALFLRAGANNLRNYNALLPGSPLRPIVLILDDLADISGEAESTLVDLVRLARAFGVHPVVGIQRPDAKVLEGQLRANLVTRIALPTATAVESRIILGHSGAEKLPKVRGRLLVTWQARLVEAQAYHAVLPTSTGAPPVVDVADKPADDRPETRIRALAAEGLSRSEIARQVFGYTGGSAANRVKQALDAAA